MKEQKQEVRRICPKTRHLILNVCFYFLDRIYLEKGLITLDSVINHKGLMVFGNLLNEGPMGLINKFFASKDVDYII